MGRSLSPMLQRELANLDKDADSRRSAMKTLKSYAKDLDSKAIPHFLAQVSETKGPNSSSGECTISLFEVLARVHGRNIVPQIDNIMSTIIRTLSSSAGSFSLHQACSKVVPAIARYGIDPCTPDSEKTRIISSLCKPLSDVLMGSQESLASGAALCLRTLVESNNWKFASDEMVNEVCLKVAGALEEKMTQTNSHMGLVMALAKHNSMTTEAYARSLIRSGLQILSGGLSDNNSQKRFSAIQMINFLMKCVDSRSISTELAKVTEVMEKCQADHMAYVRGAAFEASQTAKMIALQKGSKHEITSTPVTGSNFYRKNDKSPRAGTNSLAEFASPESQTIDSSINLDVFTDSPISVGQSSCNYDHSRRANRRLWNNDHGGVDVSLKDGLFLKACSNNDDVKSDVAMSDTENVNSDSFSGFVQARPTSKNDTTTSQGSRTPLTIDDIKIYSTPRKLIRSLQNSTNANTAGPERQHNQVVSSPTSFEVEWNRTMEKTKERNIEKMSMIDGTESVSSTDDLPKVSACKVSEECDEKYRASTKIVKRSQYKKATIGFVWGLLLVFLAIIFSVMRTESNEEFFDLVPT